MTRLKRWIGRFGRRECGTATVEFVLIFPFVMAILLTSIDFSAFMLRQVFLDRAVDMAVRQVMLGNVPSSGANQFKTLICNGTILISNCQSSITVEMRPIDTDTWPGIYDPVQCIDRAANITPTLTFNPSNGNQDLMLVRVCAAVDPFIDLTGLVFGMNQTDNGDYLIVSVSAFTNEPAS